MTRSLTMAGRSSPRTGLAPRISSTRSPSPPRARGSSPHGKRRKPSKPIIPNDFGLLASVPPSLSPTAGTMPGDPRLRASDADRERTAQLLREHHAVGRLTAEEFNSRVEKALEARTLGELDELLADLPAIDLYQLPSAGIRPTRRGGSGPRGSGLEPVYDGRLVPGRDVPRAGLGIGDRAGGRALGGDRHRGGRRRRLDPVVPARHHPVAAHPDATSAAR